MRVTFPNVGNQVADAVCKISDFPCSLYVELDVVIARGQAGRSDVAPADGEVQQHVERLVEWRIFVARRRRGG